MRLVKPPLNDLSSVPAYCRVFLGGSINMGASADWQTEVFTRLQKTFGDYTNYSHYISVYNPRRTDWDSSWDQTPVLGSPFYEQVTWEMRNQDEADVIVYNFEPEGMSPITLLELGLYLNSGKYIFVVCPEEYSRYGNVKLTCEYKSDRIRFYTSRDEVFYNDLTIRIDKIINDKAKI